MLGSAAVSLLVIPPPFHTAGQWWGFFKGPTALSSSQMTSGLVGEMLIIFFIHSSFLNIFGFVLPAENLLFLGQTVVL